MIKTKSKGREGRDDVSFDLDDEEGKEEDEDEMKKGGSAREKEKEACRKREKNETYERDDRLRSTRSVNNTKADCGRG